MQKRGQDARDRLAVDRDKAFGRRHLVTYRRFGFPQDVALPPRILERPGAGQPFGASQIDCLFDGRGLYLADHDQVRQTLLDGPGARRRAPVETGLAQARRQFLGFACNLFKLLMILFEFGMHQSEL